MTALLESAPVYCALKAPVRTFTRALRYQCQDQAPHVSIVDAVLPLVDTEMTRGRGRGKISLGQAASSIVEGVRRERAEIYVGKSLLLHSLMRGRPSGQLTRQRTGSR